MQQHLQVSLLLGADDDCQGRQYAVFERMVSHRDP